MKEIKLEVQTLIDNWYHGVEFNVIQVWEQDDTWFLAIQHYQHYTKGKRKPENVKLDFVRIFPSYRLKGEYHLSVDNTINI